MELALSLEKLNFHKLRELHDVADASHDAQMADFVEDMLAEQVTALLHQWPCACLPVQQLAYLFSNLHVSTRVQGCAHASSRLS